jgi:hypothetical protein
MTADPMRMLPPIIPPAWPLLDYFGLSHESDAAFCTLAAGSKEDNSLDQMSAETDELMANPADTGNLQLIEQLPELLADMRARIEAKLENKLS